MKKVDVTFHFTSGKEISASIPMDEWDNLKINLGKNWDIIVSTASDYGINFRHVTHYEIMHEDEMKKNKKRWLWS